MGLAAGSRLGPYEILAAIGAGGMGEVYKARDTRLERDVALKVLPAATLTDATARARLVREARLASKLNHPHICTIYEVGETEGQTHIAMELVEGQTLSARLQGGALAIDDVVRYGQQLASALAHAHARGVVHRDFKSANVVVTPDGQVKVLDFGLARRLAGDAPADDPTMSRQTQAPSRGRWATWRRSSCGGRRRMRGAISGRWGWCCTSCWRDGDRSRARRRSS
jgi:serine/threonine protein kinase